LNFDGSDAKFRYGKSKPADAGVVDNRMQQLQCVGDSGIRQMLAIACSMDKAHQGGNPPVFSGVV
jgi:hypothetical protein